MTGDFLAVIGMAGRFPGAADLDAFWAALAAGQESIRRGPADPETGQVPAFGVLADADEFDAGFFGYPAAEALLLDPQHRIFLECAWAALEDAGYPPGTGSAVIGVYGGCGDTGFGEVLAAHRERLGLSDWQLRLASGVDFLTTRVAYKLGLTGPAITVQTACSTSLVAVHLAGQALLSGACDLALAGGVTAHVPAPATPQAEDGVLAPDGHCRAFDAAARGTVGGDGVGIVVLKRLDEAIEDGDHIRAVLRGSAVNNDGGAKVGFTAPSVPGQAAAVRAAFQVAGVDPGTIGYLEAHGTGTPVGDPIEIAALTRVFRADTGRSAGCCRIGSVKTNIGHTDAAAGVAGLIKAVLALENDLIPPTLHFAAPNPDIDFAAGPFVVATEPCPWPRGAAPRRAAVNSLGIGGTNAHVVLEEAPAPAERPDPPVPWHLLVLSARSPAALDAATERLAGHLRRHPEVPLADAAWTLQAGRRAFPHRRFAVCADAAGHADAVRALRDPDRLGTASTPPRPRDAAFLFPGHGAQHPGMCRELYAHAPVFRHELDRCCELLNPGLGFDLRTVLCGRPDDAAAGRLRTMVAGQAAVFAVEYSLALLWRSWGVTPGVVAGHSLGAYAAACVAGILSFPDAVRLVLARGRLLDRLPAGSMLAVPLPEKEVTALLDGGLSLAAVNGPARCVLSGPVTAVDRLRRRLGAAGIDARPLRIHAAAHSSQVDQVLEEFRALAATVALRPPDIPMISDTTGQLITTTDAEYWAAHLRRPVRFADVLTTLLSRPDRTLVEVGPGTTLTTLARQHPDLDPAHVVSASLSHPAEPRPDLATMLAAAGRLWLAGEPIDWSGIGPPARRRVPLPTYPFERRPYRLDDPRPQPDENVAGRSARDARSPLERDLVAAFADVLGMASVSVHDNFFDLGGDSLIASRLVARLRQTLAVEVPAQYIYRAPTVARLAAHLAGRLAPPRARQSGEPR